VSGLFVSLLLLFALNSVAQIPVVRENGVLNAASFALPGQPGNPLAPGSLVSIFGEQFAMGVEEAGTIPLPAMIQGVSVTFNGKPAPLLFISGNQINAQLPWDVVSFTPPGTTEIVRVVVTRGGIPSGSQNVTVGLLSPGVFAFSGRYAVAVNPHDSTVTQPDGAIPGVNTRPVTPGDVVIVYANGLGPVDTIVETGSLGATPIIRTTTTPTVLIGGVEAEVLFSGLAPQFVGVNQLNVVIPHNIPAGDAVPLQIRMGGITTSDAVTIAIRP
jgi:uncharacterized protein (TIGR03437 family)